MLGLYFGHGTCTWFFALHTGKSQVQMYIILYLSIEAQKLGLVHTSGTWDPCEPAFRDGRPGLKKAMAGATVGKGRSYC